MHRAGAFTRKHCCDQCLKVYGFCRTHRVSSYLLNHSTKTRDGHETYMKNL
jgi:hypothetical protein